jgi:predicted phosphodiesterase
MIKIAYGSDFHFERYPADSVYRFIEGWKFEELTTHIVIAGDMHVGAYNVASILDFIWNTHKIPVIYVPGNHEYYRNSYVRFDQELCSFQNEKYIILLRDWIRANNTLFIGAQCVSDGSYEEAPGMPLNKDNYADFWMINDFEETYRIYGAEDRRFINNILLGSKTYENTVVISHNPPHPMCIDEKYRGDVNNGLFVNDYTTLLVDHSPDIWICGHTHSKFYKVVNNTRVLCNPHGYEFEPTSKNWKWEYVCIN